MNIFTSYDCPYASARALDDARVNKMVTESAQMLSTALHMVNQPRWEELHAWDQDQPLDGGKRIFKPTHRNHPCNIWVRESRKNFWWLWQHAMTLGEIYQAKANRVHKSVMCLTWVQYEAYPLLPDVDRTPFSNSTRHKELGIDFGHIEDVHEAYRLYLNARWPHDKRAPAWKGRERPDWCTYGL